MPTKQYAFAVIIILLGVAITQLKPPQPFNIGAGVGTIAMASVWLIIRIIREYRKK